MALDFTQVVPQVTNMGQTVAAQNTTLSERVLNALDQFDNLPDNATALERVKLARIRDAGYRGVAPLAADSEPLQAVYSCPPAPDRATLLAADGSQIYPDQHSAAFYYLINIGLFTYYHGENRLPHEYSAPQLFYEHEDTHDRAGNPIKNAAINARRTVQEISTLADHAWEQRGVAAPLVTLYDGPLLFWMGQDVPDARRLERAYHQAFQKLYDAHTTTSQGHGHPTSLLGYIDRPSSRFFVALLYLLSLAEDEVDKRALETLGVYEGLTDLWLFRDILQPGERSALMVQQSPQNKAFRNDIGEEYEIAFFYVNVARTGPPTIARVEMPMWVARSPLAVEQVHALVVSQCEIMGNYPYALTRADELAVVRTAEKNALENMIRTELLKHHQPIEESAKLIGKHQTRTPRRRFGDHLPPAGQYTG